MKTELTWQTGDGQKVVFTVSLKKEETLLADSTMTKPCCCIDYYATVSGKDVGSWKGLDEVKNHPVIVASIGKLGIKKENYKMILDAVEEIKKSEYWVAWQKKLDDAEKLDSEYRAHVARVNEMMNP